MKYINTCRIELKLAKNLNFKIRLDIDFKIF